MNVKITENNAAIESTHAQTLAAIARTDALAVELVNFRKESQNGVINATKAANEARGAVNAALVSLQNIEPPATVASVTVLQDELTALRSELANVRINVGTKADIQEVNEALEEKASKTLVAAALHKKLSISKVADTLQPTQTKVNDVERTVVILQERISTLSSRVDTYINTSTETTTSWFTSNSSSQAQLQNQVQQEKSSFQLTVNTLESRIGELETSIARTQERTAEAQKDLQYVRTLTHNDTNKLREDTVNLRQEINTLNNKLSSLTAVHMNDRTNQTIMATAEATANSAKLLIVPLEEQISQLVKEVETIHRIMANVEKMKLENVPIVPVPNVTEPSRSLDTSFTSVRSNVLPPGGTVSLVSPSFSSNQTMMNTSTTVNQRLKLELEATRNDLRTVAGEVQGIIDLLDIGSIAISTVSPKSSKKKEKIPASTNESKEDSTQGTSVDESKAGEENDQPSAIKVSAATAAQALRSAVTHLTERMANAEHDIADLRTRCIGTEERIMENSDTLLQHSSFIQSLDAETQILQQRVDSLELTSVIGSPLRSPVPVSRSTEGISRLFVPNSTPVYAYPNSLVSTEPVYPSHNYPLTVPGSVPSSSSSLPNNLGPSRIGPMHTIPVSSTATTVHRIVHQPPHSSSSVPKNDFVSPIHLQSPLNNNSGNSTGMMQTKTNSSTKGLGNTNNHHHHSSRPVTVASGGTTTQRVTEYATNRYHQAKLHVHPHPTVGVGQNMLPSKPVHKETLVHAYSHRDPSPTPDHRWH